MNRPYSEATRDLVAAATEQHHIVYGQTDAVGNSPCACGQWWDLTYGDTSWDQHMAEVALDALAEAGLLLPEGVETRTEWTAPPEPGPEVTAVRDKHGRRWGRHAGLWCYTDDQLRHTHLYWHELFSSFPLTDITPPDAVRLAEGDTNASDLDSVPVEETTQ